MEKTFLKKAPSLLECAKRQPSADTRENTEGLRIQRSGTIDVMQLSPRTVTSEKQ
jgi:hypothetical protein